MALILCIDTSYAEASVCIAENGSTLAVDKNAQPTDHAGWLPAAIQKLLTDTGRTLADLKAVAVAAGPGSYTGLRVGMATAKGICFARQVPLIIESTLSLLAHRVKKEMALDSVREYPVLICPMIDARRMEVFTTLYDTDLSEQMQPAAMILDQTSFSAELFNHVIMFCGNGAEKWQHLCIHPNAVFVAITPNIADLADVAARKFNKNEYSDLAYTEPAYLKNVYTGKKQVD